MVGRKSKLAAFFRHWTAAGSGFLRFGFMEKQDSKLLRLLERERLAAERLKRLKRTGNRLLAALSVTDRARL